MKSLLFFCFILPLTAFAQFEGDWYASFTVMGNSMRMQLDISETPKTEVLLINPDAKSTVACDVAEIKGKELTFQWNSRNLSFEGRLEDNKISGKMSQGGISWDVVFTPDPQEKAVVKRPQTPKGPFDYSTDSLTIENGEITLGATLVLPKNFDASTPIVILVSGSGPQNRDCEIAGHQPFWVIADYLAQEGIASLRFDDRGTGTSSGDYSNATVSDLGSDVEACARYLRKEMKFKKNPLGAAGHSEGGMHILLAAIEYKKIDFLIHLATVGTSGKEVLIQQQYDIPKAGGNPEALATWNRDLFAQMSTIVLGYPTEEASGELQKLLGKAYDTAPESFDKTTRPRAQFIMGNILFMNSSWMREFLAFDTEEYLEKVDVPLLAIHAGDDVQVSALENSFEFSKYPQATTHILPGLNHLFQPCEACTIEEYGDLDTTFSTDALKLISDWVLNLPQD